MLSSDFPCKMTERLEQRKIIFVLKSHRRCWTPQQWLRLHEHHNNWWHVQGVRVRPGNQIVPSFSLQWKSDKREKVHACAWRFKVASCKRASLKSTRFLKKVGYFSNRVVYNYQQWGCGFDSKIWKWIRKGDHPISWCYASVLRGRAMSRMHYFICSATE